MCWPQPVQVGLPHVEQVIRAHMMGVLSRGAFVWGGRRSATRCGIAVRDRGDAVPPLPASGQRRSRREKNPPRAARAAAICAWLCVPLHHSDAGTVAFTIATC